MFTNKAIKLFLFSCLLFVYNIEGREHTSIRGKIATPTSRLLEDDTSNVERPESTSDDTSPSSDDTSSSSDDSSPSSDDSSPSNDSSSSDDFRGRSVISGPSRRDCRTSQSESQIHFQCKAESESDGIEIEDEIEFTVGATRGDFLRVTIEHESEIEDETNGSDTEIEVETKFTVVYDRLIEYRKVGNAADDHFEWDADEIVNEYSLDDWNGLTPLQTEGDLLKFSASMGIATFSFTISQTDSLDLTTNRMKIDFLLENYPWAETGDTFIALVSHIETERTTEIEQEGGRDVVRDVIVDFRDVSDASEFVPFGEYTWANTAEATTFDSNGEASMTARQANGNTTDVPAGTTSTISVVASTAPQSQTTGARRNINEIAFSFTGAGRGADRIYWDPEAGVGYASDSTSSASSMGAQAAIIGAAIGIALVL